MNCSFTQFIILLSLLLLNQFTLVAAEIPAKFIEVPRSEHSLAASIVISDNTKPAFGDIDKDGDSDVFIVENIDDNSGFRIIKYYKNIGTKKSPIFEENTGRNNPFNNFYENEGTASKPLFNPDTEKNYLEMIKLYSLSNIQFIDIEMDYDLDVFINEDYYENTGSINYPFFVERPEQDKQLKYDEDFDAFIGAEDGQVYYSSSRLSNIQKNLLTI